MKPLEGLQLPSASQPLTCTLLPSWKTGEQLRSGCSSSDLLLKLLPSLPPSKSTPAYWAQNSTEQPLVSIANHLQAGSRKFPQNWKKTDGRGKSPGSRRTQFKSGAGWTGNRGGRPRIVKEETAKWLEEGDKSGKTNARKMVEAMGKIAIAGGRGSVAAFREIRQTVEQNENEVKGGAGQHR
jgi:hypothetical protein